MIDKATENTLHLSRHDQIAQIRLAALWFRERKCPLLESKLINKSAGSWRCSISIGSMSMILIINRWLIVAFQLIRCSTAFVRAMARLWERNTLEIEIDECDDLRDFWITDSWIW
jgi:hypothetical protein